jgi:putative hydrolase of the HAD superfamily
MIVDGDNTLWDTNSVFADAQVNILKCLRRSDSTFNLQDGFRKLRQIDDVLIKQYGRHEYDFSVLVLALYHFFKGEEEEAAVRMACRAFETRTPSEGMDIAVKCGKQFKKDLRKFPALFKDSKKTLQTLKKRGAVLILSSEGDKERISRILNHYLMKRLFDHIMDGAKSVEQLKEAKNVGTIILKNRHSTAAPKTVVVGDLLDRDILFGNKIGAITIYRPGGYKGRQTPQSKDEIPDYEIYEFREIIDILDRNLSKED